MKRQKQAVGRPSVSVVKLTSAVLLRWAATIAPPTGTYQDAQGRIRIQIVSTKTGFQSACPVVGS